MTNKNNKISADTNNKLWKELQQRTRKQ